MNNITHISLFISAVLIASSAFGAETPFAPQSSGLPVPLSLDKPGYVTAVIERADGRWIEAQMAARHRMPTARSARRR